MTVTLPPDLERFVQDQIAHGTFPTADEAVEAGLRLLREKHAELKAMVAEAIAQADRGESEPFDPFAILAEARAARASAAEAKPCGG